MTDGIVPTAKNALLANVIASGPTKQYVFRRGGFPGTTNVGTGKTGSALALGSADGLNARINCWVKLELV